ncbi:lichenysin synthetase A [Paenibacillus mucilaginosus 3016]|uniref:Lichenysin synthetase A n=1 Tax=Paenibacillus mucilaginosus 3016 TaxID=1116391 RepID=H6NFR5_9BACL|nr:non-ribosomal peptide synthetase [Paenibacillus mucilaginosus]AFC30705.1 lichenysin synthetase A [Paenibacillus mucilaginosus 3016]
MSDLIQRLQHLPAQQRAALIERMKRRLTEQDDRIQAAQNRGEEAPLSITQERLWLQQQLEPGSPFYNLPVCLRIRGPLNVHTLQSSFSQVVRRHEILRTVIRTDDDGRPVQVPAAFEGTPVEVRSCCGDSPESRLADVQAQIRELLAVSLDMSRPLWRASLWRIGDEEHVLFLILHHVIFDGWSLSVLIGDLLAFYRAGTLNGEPALDPLDIQYPDYAAWQRSRQDHPGWQEQLSYWKEELADVPALHLHSDLPRPPVQTFNGSSCTVLLPKSLWNSLKEFSRREGVTPFITLLAAFKVMLYQHTGQSDFAVGTPVSGRSRPELELLVGPFINTLAIRTDLSGNPGFAAVLAQVREKALGAFEHQDVPFDRVVHAVSPQRVMSHSPLFQVMFTLQKPLPPLDGVPELDWEFMLVDRLASHVDLSMEVFEGEEGAACLIEYNTDLFRTERMERLAAYFRTLLESILLHPLQKIDSLGSEGRLTPEEKLTLERFNQTERAYPQEGRGATLHGLFDERVRLTPERTAIVSGAGEWSYRELGVRANRTAAALRLAGIRPGSVVAVFAERSPELVASLFGILKAGAAYMPVDPSHPAERIAYLLQDSGAAALLALAPLPGELTSPVPVLDAESLHSEAAEPSGPAPWTEEADAGYHPESLAYVIYTSGSTGLPKGVQVEHRSAVNTLRALQERYPLEAGSRFLFKTPYTFDVSVPELFGGLLEGASLAVLPAGDEKDPRAMLRALERFEVTHVNFVPSMLRLFLEEVPPASLPRLEYVFSVGEALAAETARTCLERLPQAQLANLYGPTEAAVYAVCAELTAEDAERGIPIGTPLANMRAYVLNAADALQPIGVPGELCLAGVGVARGYGGRPELTQEMFSPDPFVPGGRMYRTGDLARWLPDGKLEYLGRIDQQIKLRGYRIEPGEIEARLLEIGGVQEAAVVLHRDTQENADLCAYVVCSELTDAEGIRRDLQRTLPPYMVPAYIMKLDRLPVTASGKLDRKSLPRPELQAGKRYVPPGTAMETGLVRIWQELLERERIGIRDDFFRIGGHSLKAAMLVSRIHQELQREASLRDVFRCPTVESLARLLEEQTDSPYAGIPAALLQPWYPVSSAQKRLYILQQLDGAELSYNMPGVMELTGRLDRARLEQALQSLVRRHEALRTSFALVEGEPRQRILPPEEVQLELGYVHAQDLVPAGSAGQSSREADPLAGLESGRESVWRSLSAPVKEYVRSFIRPFRLEEAPLVRAGLVGLAPERHLLLLDMHHLIADGVTMELLAGEWMRLYEGEELPPLRLQYKDYACWQQQFLQSERIERQQRYWEEQLAGELTPLELPSDAVRPAVRSFAGDRLHFELDGELSGALRRLAEEEQSTLYMVLLALYTAWLSRLSGQEEVLVGTPVAGRPHRELEGIAGMFVNTLVIRSRPQFAKAFRDYLKEIRQTSMDALEHADVPFESLVEKLELQRDLSRNPLFDAMFAWQNMDRSRLDSKALQIWKLEADSPVAKFDLTLFAEEREGRIVFELEYSTALFRRESVERWARSLIKLARAFSAEPDLPLAEASMLQPAERRLLTHWNTTDKPYPKQGALATLHGLFDERVRLTPERTALVSGAGEWSYRELDARANRTAAALRLTGVGPGSVVAVFAERSPELVASLFGILKTGAAYMPVDPSHPAERIAYLLQDSGAAALLALAPLPAELTSPVPVVDAERLHLEAAEPSGPAPWTEEADAGYDPESLAYVIYTSGSTGLPKGVQVEHRSAVNTLRALQERYPVQAGSRFLFKTPYTFDVSVPELFSGLLEGASLAVLPAGDEKDPRAMLQALERFEVTHVNFVPSMLRLFLEEVQTASLPRLEYVFSAGEALASETARTCLRRLPHAQLVNLYGPTEAAVYAVCAELTAQDAERGIPIGTPLANTRAYVLNAADALQPIGVPGELCLAGAGVARGYGGRPELTAERFSPDPFIPGGRMYRTGDLARWRPDGRLEYLGRIDQQIKLRGYRIEPGEIEARLLEIEGVREAAVVLHRDAQGDADLCAYVVCSELTDAESIRRALQRTLPPYMVPAYIMKLDRLPVTASGKLDRKSLPRPELQAGERYVPPGTAMETGLVRIWQELLGRERIGIRDDFFRIGGHSLKAAMLVSRIHQELQREASLRDVFRCPTVESLARLLEEQTDSPYAAIPSALPQSWYPVSSAQKRLYILQQLDGAELSYNMPGVLELTGRLDRVRLGQALQALIRRHEALRTSFALVEVEPRQRILQPEEVRLDLGFVDAQDLVPAGSGEADTDAVQESGWAALSTPVKEYVRSFIRPFRLEEAPLVRAGLIGLAPERHLLLLDMHHLIADGVTMELLAGEWMRLYEGEELTPLRLQYKDYACWQQQFLQSERIERQQRYWEEQLAGELTPLELPSDTVRPAVRSFAGDRLRFELDPELSGALRRLAEEEESTLYMVLLALYTAWLSRLSGQEEVLVGTPVAGRPHRELEGIAGMFVNTLVLRTRPQFSKAFRDYLKEIRQTSMDALEHADVPFESLVEKLELQRDLSRNPLFDAMFAWQNMDKSQLDSTTLQIRKLEADSPVAKFDLTLFAEEREGRIVFELEYSTALFRRDSVEQWAHGFLELARAFSANPQLGLSEASLLSEAEQRKLLALCSGPQPAYPAEGMPATIHGLFEAQAARTPGAVALVSEEGELTYGQLQERTDSLAERLRGEGLGPGCFVGILAERSIRMVCAALAVLKAGAAYVPLDASLPVSRLQHITGSLGMRAVMATASLGDQALALLKASPFMQCVVAAEDGSVLGRQADGEGAVRPQPSAAGACIEGAANPAYAIFTSGSTGTPKGVVVSHRPVVNLITWVNETFGVGPQDRVLFVTSLSFDLSVYDIFGLLAAGGSVRIVAEQDLRSPQRLLALLKDEPVTLWDSAPAALAQLEPFFPEAEMSGSLRLVLLSGDWIPLTLPPALKRVCRGVRVIALGGATEAAVWSNFHEVGEIDPEWTSIPYGRPIRGARYYVLDSHGNLCPAGVPGELYIGGECLADGYAGDPALTAERFVPDPYGLYPGARMYRTGDRARWRTEGWLEFLGRTDRQVKIRGYRIEPGEIQAALLAHPDITAAVVTPWDGGAGERTLCAYLVSDRELPVTLLREFLAERLPGYMIPSHFVRLDAMPVTANGKLDVKALPAPPDEVLTGAPYEGPRSPAEELLVQLWQDVLQVRKVSIHDPFFSLGGDSIKAIQVMSRLHKHGLRLDVRDFFQYPTIAGLSLHLQAESAAAPQEEITGESALTPVQRWFFERLGREAHFNQAMMLYRREGFREEIIREVFTTLVRHHDALRLVFPDSGTPGFRAVHRPAGEDGFTMESFDWTKESGQEGRIEAECTRIQSGMNLDQGPLVRLGLFHTPEGDHLLIAVHHLVIDSVSWRILLEDVITLYSGMSAGVPAGTLLPPKTHPFRDWAAGLERYALSTDLFKEKSYWAELAKGTEARLPVDGNTGEAGRRTIRLSWSPELTKSLIREAGRVYNADMDVMLLTALARTLEEAWGLHALLVQLEGHGREGLLPELNVSRTVGWFTSMYPVKLELGRDRSPGRSIKSVKEHLRQVPRRGAGFGVLKYLTPPADRKDFPHSLLPEISFNYMGEYQQRLDAGGTELSRLQPGSSFNPRMPLLHVWNLNAHQEQDALILDWEYDAGLHRRETMERIAGHLHEQLRLLADHCAGVRETEHTPTDFAYKNLGLDELEELLEEVAAGLNEEE